MIKKIDLFMPPRSKYGVLHNFTEKLAEAIKNQGVECHILEAEYYNPRPFLEKLMEDKPDCTLSFNGLLPDDEGRFFSSMVKIPHIAYIVDTPTHFFPLAHDNYTIIANVDNNGCEFFRGLGAKNVIFSPHGVDRNLAPVPHNVRDHDVVMFASLIDYRTLRASWDEKYTSPLVNAMETTIEAVLGDNTTPFVQAFVRAIDLQMKTTGNIDTSKIDFVSVLDDIEMYIKGKSRIDLLRAVKDSRVDLYGSAAETAEWSDFLSDCPNIIVHDPVPFNQVLDLMKQSKIVLNASPWIKAGSHERVFASLACGALPVTCGNDYLKQYFIDGKSIAFYNAGEVDEVNKMINEYLDDEEKRVEVCHNGRHIVMEHHTWDDRAKALLVALEPILNSIKTAEIIEE